MLTEVLYVAWQIVSALAIDNSGSRVLSGSYDYNVRMYDFGGMNSTLQSFRHLEPSEGHQVRHLSWSPTADKFLCVTGSAQAKVLVPFCYFYSSLDYSEVEQFKARTHQCSDSLHVSDI